MRKKSIVFGSFVVDLMARAPHLPEDGETVKGTLFKMGAGGKGFNQGVAAHKSGGDIIISTKIGDDEFGRFALNTMDDLGVDKDYIFIDEKEATGAALIGVSEETGQNDIIVVPGACGLVKIEELDQLVEMLDQAQYLLTQLETNIDAIEYIIDKSIDKGVKVILNPAPIQEISDTLLSKVDLITPNEVEAKIITGIEINTEEDALKACKWFEQKGILSTIITWGSKGAYYYENGEGHFVPSLKVDAIDTTGAGDAFNGALLTALSEGKTLEKSVLFANAAAALSVTRMGTTPAMASREEIDEFYKKGYGEQ